MDAKISHTDPKKKCFGGRVVIKMDDGSTVTDELEVADAHPSGRRPFVRSDYINKFVSLTDGIITSKESKKFLNSVQNLKKLKANEIKNLNIEVKKGNKPKKPIKKAIF